MMVDAGSPRCVGRNPRDPLRTFDEFDVKRSYCTPATNSSSLSITASGNIATATIHASSGKPRRRNSSRLPTSKKIPSRDRPVVDHAYTDHFHDPIAGFDRNKDKKFATRGGVTTPFPEKLHAMLNSSELEGVVGWQPHGRSFLIRDKDIFVNEIMPKYVY